MASKPLKEKVDPPTHIKWSAREDLHLQGCLILSQVGLLFPVNHAPF